MCMSQMVVGTRLDVCKQVAAMQELRGRGGKRPARLWLRVCKEQPAGDRGRGRGDPPVSGGTRSGPEKQWPGAQLIRGKEGREVSLRAWVVGPQKPRTLHVVLRSRAAL